MKTKCISISVMSVSVLFIFFFFIRPAVFVQYSKCALLEHRDGASFFDVGLLSCSNKEQKIEIDSFKNLSIRPAEIEGWEVISTVNKKEPGVFAILLKKRILDDKYIFYPRVESPSDGVIVKEERHFPTRLFSLHIKEKKWTPIGAQYVLDSDCFEYSSITDKTVELHLKITLYGEWAQLWVKNGAVFF